MNALFKLTLKSSAIGALAFFAVTSGCSDASKDDEAAGGDSSTTKGGSSTTAGSTSKAGAPSGGDDTGSGTGGAKNGTGGEAQGGAPDVVGVGGHPDIPFSTGGASSEGGAGTGPAVAKFCNTLTFQDEPTTMILEVGEGPNKVTFTADTGECVPADGDACVEIPQGDAVLVQMFDSLDTENALDFANANVKAGQDWIFYTDVVDDQPQWAAGTIAPDATVTCEDITYDDI